MKVLAILSLIVLILTFVTIPTFASEMNVVPSIITSQTDANVTIYGYHFHIYFLPNDEFALHSAKQIYEKAKALWGTKVVREGAINIFEKPVGPHPFPMVQICLEDEKNKDTNFKLFLEVLPWVQLNVDLEEHPLLLHPLSTPFSPEEELKDHTVRALWIGQKLKLNTRQL